MSTFRSAVALAAAWGAFSTVLAQEISVEPVAGRVHLVSGGGGANVSVLAGDGRALIVDSKSPAAAEEIAAQARTLSGGDVAYLINGHVHPDHTDGNVYFGERGAVIVAHAEVREILAAGQRGGPPSPPAALPTLTFPDGGDLTLVFDDEPVRIFHAPPAHSHDNSIVHFMRSNVLHLGDIYGPSRYPVIAGGTIDGFIEGCDMALALADAETRIVPGVGAATGRETLRAYRDMLALVRERVARAIEGGASLEDVIASQPTREFDATYGAPDHRLFLPVIYEQLGAR
jgi:glyoxylase-like metal-dependent hydrolase (beta-lactamase superfamily II)